MRDADPAPNRIAWSAFVDGEPRGAAQCSADEENDQEGTTPYQVAPRPARATSSRGWASVARRGGCRWMMPSHRRGRELATVVSDLDRRHVVEVLGGRSRGRVKRYLRSLGIRKRAARSRWSRSIPTRPTARRSEPCCPRRGSSATTSTSCGAPTPRSSKGARRSGQQARWGKDGCDREAGDAYVGKGGSRRRQHEQAD